MHKAHRVGGLDGETIERDCSRRLGVDDMAFLAVGGSFETGRKVQLDCECLGGGGWK
jgi:hypothetical protein